MPALLFRGALLAAILVAAISVALALLRGAPRPEADPVNAPQVALGRTVYARHCASCHGAKLEGQPNWRERLPSGRLPAPPHDETGHTWHHPDAVLFGITKYGLTGTRYAPKGYESDMPAFDGVLTDEEIWGVLAYIKSTWPPPVLEHQREIQRQSDRQR